MRVQRTVWLSICPHTDMTRFVHIVSRFDRIRWINVRLRTSDED